VMPRDVAELCRLAAEGDGLGARAVHEKLFNLTKLLFIESNPVPVKWAVHLMGKIGPEIRLPLSQLGEQHRGALQAELARLGAAAELVRP
jgi:4-hydroxy-tetrahydrodipicolinate synthase